MAELAIIALPTSPFVWPTRDQHVRVHVRSGSVFVGHVLDEDPDAADIVSVSTGYGEYGTDVLTAEVCAIEYVPPEMRGVGQLCRICEEQRA